MMSWNNVISTCARVKYHQMKVNKGYVEDESCT